MRTLRIVSRTILLLTVAAIPVLGLAQAVTFTPSLNPVTPGQSVTFTGTTTLSVNATSAKVTLWFYNSANSFIGSASQTGITFTYGVPHALSISYATSSSLPAGTYHYNLSYYDSTGAALAGAYGQASDGTFVVGTSTGPSYTINPTPQPVAAATTLSFVSKLNPFVSATNATVKLWIYNSSNTYIGVTVKTGVSFTAGQSTPVTFTYAVPGGLASSTYHFNLSYYQSDGTTALPGAGNQTNAGNFVVAAGASPSSICSTGVVVGLKWPAVASATSYTVSRNGSALGSTALLTYSDHTVVPSTTYNYAIQAFDGATALTTKTLVATAAATSANGDPAYCPSTVLNAVTVGWGSASIQLNGSDLWAQTLGSDGDQYGFFGDGDGFGGSQAQGAPKVSWGTAAITSSTPGSLTGAVNVYGGLNAQHPANISGKATGILAIGPPSNQNFYALGGVKASGSGTSGGANDQEIVYSTGNPWSWTDNAPNWIFCSGLSGASTTDFCATAFLQNGPGYAGNTDGYVYLYGGTQLEYYGNGTPGVQYSYLWRVRSTQAQILNNTDYEAFTGLDVNGNPTWVTGNFATLKAAMQPVYTDRQARALPFSEITYNAGLGRYIASAEGAVNQVAFYEAPNPWGPWASIGYFNSNPADNSGGWGNLGQGIALSGWGNGSHGDGLGTNFIDKWASVNGQTMWVVFSSNSTASTSASITALQGQNMDGFLAVPLTITPK